MSFFSRSIRNCWRNSENFSCSEECRKRCRATSKVHQSLTSSTSNVRVQKLTRMTFPNMLGKEIRPLNCPTVLYQTLSERILTGWTECEWGRVISPSCQKNRAGLIRTWIVIWKISFEFLRIFSMPQSHSLLVPLSDRPGCHSCVIS